MKKRLVLLLTGLFLIEIIAIPKNIHWGSANNPLNGLTVSWFNTTDTDSIKWGYTANHEIGAFSAARRPNIEGGYVYDFEFPILQPVSTIHYSIKDINWGAPKTFKTSPDTQVSHFSFIAGGDSRSYPMDWNRVANQMAAGDADFYLHLADQVYKPNIRQEWEQYFTYGKTLMENNLVFHCGGNHDFGTSYKYYLVLPRNESVAPYYENWYCFEFGNALFISLLTQTHFTLQHEWLQNVLANNDKTWTIVFLHKPFFGSVSSEMTDKFDTWWKTFDDYGVDVVLAGHAHYYMRNKPINYNVSRSSPVAEYGSQPGQGRLHIVTGGLGAELMNTPPAGQWYMEISESVLHYVHFEVDNNVLYMNAFRDGGTLIDSVIIEKEVSRIQRSIAAFPNAEILAYPNPSGSSVRITIPYFIGHADLFIYNVQGKLMANFLNVRSNSILWNPCGLPNGIYIAKACVDGKRLSKRFYLQK
jgi:hypothetical protein